jgi:glycosyltransferase involved in cell wall biosynthesis
MRIAFVTFEYPPIVIGGAGIYAKYVTKEISNLGHDVVVFTPNNNRYEEINNIKIESITTNSRFIPKAFQFWLKLPKALNKIDKKNRFDIIHFNGLSYFFLQKSLLNCPHFLTVHHLVRDAIEYSNPTIFTRFLDFKGENSFIMPLFEKWALRSVDRIIAVSNFTKNQIMKKYLLNKEKIEVIYNGVDTAVSNFNEKDFNDVRDRYNLPDKPIILFIGRVDDPRKGLDVLLKAFKHVLEQTDAILLIVGGGNQDYTRKLARSLGIFQYIYFTGFVDSLTLKKIYTFCSIYVCPSRLEGFGLTIPEAMAVGKPIVATDVGAIPEIIKNYVHGILVKSGDIRGIADAILKYLINMKYAGIVGTKNKIYLNNEFNWKKNAIQLEIFYKKSIGA